MAKETEELVKHTLNLYQGDYQKLQAMFPEVGAAIVIRKLIRRYINEIEEKAPSVDTATLEQEYTTI